MGPVFVVVLSRPGRYAGEIVCAGYRAADSCASLRRISRPPRRQFETFSA
ncbi:hypothetical protein LC55x_3601 [Lysobacter capsici]|nr:hypothetical protein LC55x_3601 [Lysobacter capsici]